MDTAISWAAIVEQARVAYEHMPELNLTPDQAARLWNIDPALAAAVLAAMADAGYLSAGPAGYVRRANGTSR